MEASSPTTIASEALASLDSYVSNQPSDAGASSVLMQLKKDQHPYKCGFCCMHFRSLEQLDSHVSQHSKPYQCGYCKYSFSTGQELLTHSAEHGTTARPGMFSTADILSSRKPESSAQVMAPYVTPNPSYAVQGGLQFLPDTDFTYQDAMHCVPGVSREYVPGLGMISVSSGVMMANDVGASMVTDPQMIQQSAASSDPPQDTTGSNAKGSKRKSDGVVPCPSCGQRFKVMEHLKKHCIMEHGYDRPFWCQHCPLRFKQIDHLTYHTKNKHSTVRAYSCPVCEKAFKARVNLWGHIRCAHLVDPSTFLKKPGKESLRDRQDMKRALEISGNTGHSNKYAKLDTAGHAALSKPKSIGDASTLGSVGRPDYSLHGAAHPSFDTGTVSYVPVVKTECARMASAGSGGMMTDGFTAEGQSGGTLVSDSQTQQPGGGEQIEMISGFNKASLGSSDGSLPCPTCGERFKVIETLKKHCLTEHADERPFQCQHCPLRFKRVDHLNHHFRSKHRSGVGFRPFVCQHCPLRFKQLSHLSRHIKGKHTSEHHPCPICQKTFSRRASLMSHVQYTHLVKPSTILPRLKAKSQQMKMKNKPHIVYTRVADSIFICPSCRQSFQQADQLKQHSIREHGKDRPFRCSQCASSFKEAEHLVSHVNSKHSAQRPARPAAPSVPHSSTQRMKRRKQRLQKTSGGAGKLKKEDDLSLPCPTCGQVFKVMKHLKEHAEQEHMDDRPFCCQLCPARFKELKHLSCHMDGKHSSLRQHACPLCEKTFKIRICLRAHVRRVHRVNPGTVLQKPEKRSYQDQLQHIKQMAEAPESSAESDDLPSFGRRGKKSSKQHGDSKLLFTCPQCQATFADVSQLARHVSGCVTGVSGSADMETDSGGRTVGGGLSEESDNTLSEARDSGVSCPTCGESFEVVAHLKYHAVKEHGDERPFVCQYCSSRFKQLAHLTSHLDTQHSSRKPYTCPVCYKSFKVIYYLRSHIRSKHGIEPSRALHGTLKQPSFKHLPSSKKATETLPKGDNSLSCEVCGKTCKSINKLKAHRRNEHDHHRPFVCSQCPAKFSTLKHVIAHEKRKHITSGVFKCPLCKEEFQMLTTLRAHIQEKHEEESSTTIIRPDDTEAAFSCKIGGKGFQSEEEMGMHRSQAHSKEQPSSSIQKSLLSSNMSSKQGPARTLRSCLLCGDTFKTEVSLKLHAFRKHSIKPSSIVLQQILATQYAHDTTAASARPQKTSSPGVKQRSGDQSDADQQQKQQGAVEIPQKAADGSVSCLTCGKSFKAPETLKSHSVKDHDDDKPFRCHMCPARCEELDHLISHMQDKHSSLEPQTCAICGDQFAGTRLAEHIRTQHPGSMLLSPPIPPKSKLVHVSCPDCGKKFYSKTSLKQHRLKEHDDGRPFKCSFCPSTFAEMKEFLNHYNILHKCEDNLPFPCPFCEKTFKVKTILKRHIQRAHKLHPRKVLAQALSILNIHTSKPAEEPIPKSSTVHLQGPNQEDIVVEVMEESGQGSSTATGEDTAANPGAGHFASGVGTQGQFEGESDPHRADQSHLAGGGAREPGSSSDAAWDIVVDEEVIRVEVASGDTCRTVAKE